MHRLIRLVLRVATAIAFIPLPVGAQEFPTRPITLIVPWPVGGATDVQMRALAEITARRLGRPIVIENKPGAGGSIGPSNMAAMAKPDGYTLSQIALSVFRQPYLAKTSYDPAKDFTYIIGISAYTFGVVVRSDSPWKSWQEFIAYAKSHPGEITYSTLGVGSTLHMGMERIQELTGTKMWHIPTRGTAENNNALLGGHVMAVADGAGWAPLVNSGQFRLLVTWGEARTKQWPNVPTLKELGIDIVESTPYGLAGPRDMDRKIVKVLHDAFRAALYDPRHLEVLEKLNQEIWYRDSAAYHDYAMEQVVAQKAKMEAFLAKNRQ